MPFEVTREPSRASSQTTTQTIFAVPLLACPQAIDTHDSLPFELCALEALLHATVIYFERRISLLTWMLDIMLNELQRQVRHGTAQAAGTTQRNVIMQFDALDLELDSNRVDFCLLNILRWLTALALPVLPASTVRPRTFCGREQRGHDPRPGASGQGAYLCQVQVQ